MNLYPTSYTKVNLRWINGLNVKSKTLKLQLISEKIPAILEKEFPAPPPPPPPLNTSLYLGLCNDQNQEISYWYSIKLSHLKTVCRFHQSLVQDPRIMLNFVVVSLWSLICNSFSAFFVLHELTTLEECKIVTLGTLPPFQFDISSWLDLPWISGRNITEVTLCPQYIFLEGT